MNTTATNKKAVITYYQGQHTNMMKNFLEAVKIFEIHDNLSQIDHLHTILISHIKFDAHTIWVQALLRKK